MSDEKEPEINLVERFIAGDEEALAELMRQCSRNVKAYLTPRMKPQGAADIDDILSDTWNEAWHHRDRLTEPGMFNAWLSRIASVIAKDHLRQQERRRSVPLTTDVVKDDDSEPSELAEFADRLPEITDWLSPNERRLFKMLLDGLSIEEVAVQLDVRAEVAAIRKERLLQRIKEKLAELPNQNPPIPTNFAVLIDPGDAPQELIAELYVALAAVYRAHGGSGLKVVEDEHRTFVGELIR